MKIYVCNVATQPGETEGYTCEDHIRVLNEHTGGIFVDIVVANNQFEGQFQEGTNWVKTDQDSDPEYPIYKADLVDRDYPWRHDSAKLAHVIMDLFQERTGPLVE
jgi:2-phospho-L-lactate transferase/gluconeogenesis factor (CofD/UPF0052 family)